MAIVRLTGQDKSGTSTTTSITVSYTSTPTVGNTMIATVYANIGTGLGTISGWTIIAQDVFDGGVRQVTVFARVVQSGDGTTVTCTGNTLTSRMSMHIYEYSGLAATLSVDGTPASTTSGASNVSSLASGNLVTTNANDLIIAAGGFNGASGTASFSNSFSTLLLDGSTSLNDANQIVSSAGTYSTTITTANSGRQGVLLVALQAAGGTNTEYVILTDGILALKARTLNNNYVQLQDSSHAVRVGKKLYMVI